MKTEQKPKIYFCSAASRLFKEAIHGTASHYHGLLLLEYNQPFPAALNQSFFDQVVLRQLQVLAKELKAKLVLIRNAASTHDQINFIYADFLNARYTQHKIAQDDLSKTQFRNLIVDVPRWEAKPMFLVCTNGKKDKCCAKFGYPIYKFLEANTNATVYECTHIGGDRFAANVVYLPYGIYYGHLQIEDVEPMLRACNNKQILFENYRGLSKFNFMQQAAECFLRSHLNDFSLHFPLSFLEQNLQGDRIALKVKLGNTHYLMELSKQVVLYPHLLTCTSKKRENLTKYYLEALSEEL